MIHPVQSKKSKIFAESSIRTSYGIHDSRKQPAFFDIHSHLNFSAFDNDREEVIKRMRNESVWTISVGTDLKTSRDVIALADKHDGIFATVGLHPDDNRKEVFNAEDYNKLVKSEKVIAVGECGLDYYKIRNHESGIMKRQKENFEKQIQFAIDNNLPLMNHFRPSARTMDAYEDGLDILNSYFKTHSSKLRGNSHFFAGNIDIAKRFLAIGFMLSFTGVITFTDNYNEVIQYTPLDMLMSETDSPFVAPVPYRGERSEPLHVKEVVRQIAAIRRTEHETVRKTLVDNAFRLFLNDSTPIP